MHPNFEKVLRFAQTTGDKLVVTNTQGDEPIVVMSLTAYAELIGFSSLKQSVREDMIESEAVDKEEKNQPQVQKTLEKPIFQKPKDTKGSVNNVIVNDAPVLAEKQEQNDGMGEEQFYLEPVE
ncbi:hypothetical protein A3B32_03260 [Candidatus Uhrbacteria bacterium RIFCSPLOWO2_01_FULL_53_9]|nr:MAG: hypothetical protein A3C17_03490 [Candidatus Uhrbacteria bacterium RIFCSPHIGHO2_02_FULL_53_13]OGL83423.1 MAG: hypothetical protein A3B32_03260 [Candidatus Uhrbacteria bacterium RIFCSPLOWO2_01_FULL_53_9]